MSKPYFHELSKHEYDALKASQTTWKDVMEAYQQPDWCAYPNALEGAMGCYSLVLGQVKSQKDCVMCELNKANQHNAILNELSYCLRLLEQGDSSEIKAHVYRLNQDRMNGVDPTDWLEVYIGSLRELLDA